MLGLKEKEEIKIYQEIAKKKGNERYQNQINDNLNIRRMKIIVATLVVSFILYILMQAGVFSHGI